MRLEDLDYPLPEDLIAQHPPVRREDARLLVVDRARGSLTDSSISQLGQWLRRGDILALNETRVRPARLRVQRASGGKLEMLFVRPAVGDATSEKWRVLTKSARHASVGAMLTTPDGTFAVEVLELGEAGERVVCVRRGDLLATLRTQGEIPLPPYIRRVAGGTDLERYQTVFARVEGAVASPTAGLHFTPELLTSLAAQGVTHAHVLLHVGPGTFRPITAADPREHAMDEEWFELSEDSAQRFSAARAAGGRLIAVGTTAVRTLESACDVHAGRLAGASGWTRKFILPPYDFQAVDGLLTNFHLPRTTLLLLVASLTGTDLLRAAYAHAVRERYRFYSYGDAMLVV